MTWHQSRPGPADQSPDGGCPWRKFGRVTEIGVESPIPARRVVNANGTASPLPLASGINAIVHDHHRAVIGESLAGPVLKKAREVLYPAAVTAGGGFHNPGQEGGVDGAAGGDPTA